MARERGITAALPPPGIPCEIRYALSRPLTLREGDVSTPSSYRGVGALGHPLMLCEGGVVGFWLLVEAHVLFVLFYAFSGEGEGEELVVSLLVVGSAEGECERVGFIGGLASGVSDLLLGFDLEFVVGAVAVGDGC